MGAGVEPHRAPTQCLYTDLSPFEVDLGDIGNFESASRGWSEFPRDFNNLVVVRVGPGDCEVRRRILRFLDDGVGHAVRPESNHTVTLWVAYSTSEAGRSLLRSLPCGGPRSPQSVAVQPHLGWQSLSPARCRSGRAEGGPRPRRSGDAALVLRVCRRLGAAPYPRCVSHGRLCVHRLLALLGVRRRERLTRRRFQVSGRLSACDG